MQQLQYMKEMIAERLNQRLRTDTVRNIFFVVGRVDPKTVDAASKPAIMSPAAEPVPNEDFLSSVEDPEIRQAFKRLLKGYSRRQRKD
jgi:hypothetical protein